MIDFDKISLDNVVDSDYKPDEGCVVVFKNGLGVICKWIKNKFQSAVFISKNGIQEGIIAKKLYATPSQVVDYMDYLSRLNPHMHFEEMMREVCTMRESTENLDDLCNKLNDEAFTS